MTTTEPIIGTKILADRVQTVMTTRSLPLQTRVDMAVAIMRERVERAYGITA